VCRKKCVIFCTFLIYMWNGRGVLTKAAFSLDFFFRGHAVTYRDIHEGVFTVRSHLDLSSATE
jgi:hypothetical protein